MKTLIKTIRGIDKDSSNKLSFKISDKGVTIRSKDRDVIGIDDLLSIILNDFDLIDLVVKYLNKEEKMYHIQAIYEKKEMYIINRKIYVYKIDEYEFPDELVATFDILEKYDSLDNAVQPEAVFITNLNKSIENLDIGILLELCRFYIITNEYILDTLRLSKKSVRKRRKKIFKYTKPDYINDSIKVSVSDLGLKENEHLLCNRYLINNEIKKIQLPKIDIRKGYDYLLVNINNEETLLIFKDFITHITKEKYNLLVSNGKVKPVLSNKDIGKNIYEHLDDGYPITVYETEKNTYYIKLSILNSSYSYEIKIDLCVNCKTTDIEAIMDSTNYIVFL